MTGMNAMVLGLGVGMAIAMPAADVATSSIDDAIVSLAQIRNQIAALGREMVRRYPDQAADTPFIGAVTPAEAQRIARLTDEQIGAEIDAKSAEGQALLQRVQALTEAGAKPSPAVAAIARKLADQQPVDLAEIAAALGVPASGARSPAFARPGATGAACTPGATVEFVYNHRRYPGLVDSVSTYPGKCVIRTDILSAPLVQGIDIPIADLRPLSGVSAAGIPEVPARGAMVSTTPEEVDAIAHREIAAAEARYDGKFVRVTARAGRARISENMLYLYADPSYYTRSVWCRFEPAQVDELRSLPTDVAVTVEGDAYFSRPYTVIIQNCRVVSVGGKPAAPLAPTNRPPLGTYICMNAGQGIGDLMLGNGSYTVGGKPGTYDYDPATGRMAFTSGSYKEWGWTGYWKTDAPLAGADPEPRIDIKESQGLRIHCYPPKG
jgi:hypothetical protein